MDKVTKFLHFVASEVIQEDFAENAESFAQLACRKLSDLGIMEFTEGEGEDPGEFSYTEPDDLDEEDE